MTRLAPVEDEAAMGEGPSSASMSPVVLGTLRFAPSASAVVAIYCCAKARNSARNSVVTSLFIDASSSLTEETNSSFCFYMGALISATAVAIVQRHRINAGGRGRRGERGTTAGRAAEAPKGERREDRPARGRPTDARPVRCPRARNRRDAIGTRW